MKEYVDKTWGWRRAEQRCLFDKAFDPRSREIIELDGERIGYISVARFPDRFRLQSIEIGSAYQSRGFGTRLVQDLISNAKAAGLAVDLRVLRVNPARRLYERLGFCVVSETETHFEMEHPGGCLGTGSSRTAGES